MTALPLAAPALAGATHAPSKEDFRIAMAKLPAAVNIITTDGPAGKGGITATAMCSLTDTPPMVLVCLHRESRAAQLVQANQRLAVNMLSAGCDELSAVFAGQRGLDMSERFETGARWITLSTGCPILADSVCGLDCEVSQTLDMGTHHIFCCRLVAIQHFHDDPSLIYHHREYKYC